MSAPNTLKIAKHGNHPFLRVVGWLSAVCGAVAALLILGAIVVTCQMLWVRYVQGQSTIWQTEMVTFMMVGATLIGLPYVQRLRGHVNVDLIPLMLPPGLRKALAVLVLLASIVVVAIMVWYGVEMWHIAWERSWRTDSVWGPLQWPIYLCVPVGFFLFLLQIIADLIAVIKGIEEPFSLDEGHPEERAD